MRNKKVIAFVAILFFLGLFWMSTAQEEGAKEDTQKQAKGLVRKDLLEIEKEDPKLPGRNIFTPRNRGMKEEPSQPFEFFQKLQEENVPSEDKDLSLSLNLRYIGYIDSGQTIVALVIFEGEAIAVEKGEKISELYTAGNISKQEIEIIGPSGERRRFPIEGEES